MLMDIECCSHPGRTPEPYCGALFNCLCALDVDGTRERGNEGMRECGKGGKVRNVHRVDGVAVVSLTAYVDVYLIIGVNVSTLSRWRGRQ